MVTGALTALQLSASAALPQQEDSLAQVLLLDESMLFTCTHTHTEKNTVETKTVPVSSPVSSFYSRSLPFGKAQELLIK